MRCAAFRLHPLRRSYRRRRRGAAAVEFAVVAPVFFLLILGMIEFGRMLMVQQLITLASREGARAAVLEGGSAANVTRQVRSDLAGSQITAASLQVRIEPDPGTASAGTPIRVTVTIDCADVSWLATPLLMTDRQLTATTTMRREAAN